MDRRSFLAGCAGLGFAASVQADEPTESPEAIHRLIQQLGSRKFREREAASRALEQVGDPELPALRQAAKDDPDAEVRRRAAMLVGRLERAMVARIVKGPFSPAEKAHRLAGLVRRGMHRAEVLSMLGKPDAALILGGCGLARDPMKHMDCHFRTCLVIIYNENDAVAEVHLFAGR